MGIAFAFPILNTYLCITIKRNKVMKARTRMIAQKKANRATKVGDECTCPTCGTKFVKMAYNQVFCKSKGGTICKDGYWNFVDESKRNNTTRISPANAAYYQNHIEPFINNNDDGLDYLLECGSR